MSLDREEVWLAQAKELLDAGATAETYHQLPPFTLSMLTYFYGANSPQVTAYKDGINNIAKGKDSRIHSTFLHAHGTLSSTVRELKNGLIDNLRAPIQGEILGDFIRVAKDALAENTCPSWLMLLGRNHFSVRSCARSIFPFSSICSDELPTRTS